MKPRRGENPLSGGPPLGPEDSPDAPRLCSRLLHREPIKLCGLSAIRHVIYWWDPNRPDADGYGYDHGFCCESHWEEFQQRWTCASSHELGPVCGMPGSLVHFDGEHSWCSFDDLPVAEPARAVVTETEIGMAIG